jgi:hypothetical protein
MSRMTNRRARDIVNDDIERRLRAGRVPDTINYIGFAWIATKIYGPETQERFKARPGACYYIRELAKRLSEREYERASLVFGESVSGTPGRR